MDYDKELLKLNIKLDTDKEKKFETYYSKLIEVNSYMNLTAITDKKEVYNKHFLDSLSLACALDLSKPISLCDVGSGAGFPSIPLAIVYDNIDVTIIDALNKRINFLNDLIISLSLKNAHAYHFRAEDYAKEKRDYFDIVTARAVARLNILVELCMPLVKIGGYFLAMKGQNASDELNESINAIEKLGGKVERTIDFNLPMEAGKRTIIVIKKIQDTPTKYPRSYAKIKERPL